MTCLKLALTRVMWTYNNMGNICERMHFILLKLSSDTYLYFISYNMIRITHTENILFTKFSCLISVPFKYMIG